MFYIDIEHFYCCDISQHKAQNYIWHNRIMIWPSSFFYVGAHKVFVLIVGPTDVGVRRKW